MIAAANLYTFVKTILWILFIIYALRFIARLAAPVLIRKAEDHLREEARRRADAQESKRPTGHVKVDQQPHGPSNPDPGGDYVDYVEIKD